MKKLMILMVFGALLAGTTGCRVAECWNYAWNSRFHPERNAPRAQPCVVDPCDSVVGESTGCGCGYNAPNITPGPVMVK
jgi:hypothetical protein